MNEIFKHTDNIAILVLIFCVGGLGWYVLHLQKFISKLVDKYAELSKDATIANTELATLLKGFISR